MVFDCLIAIVSLKAAEIGMSEVAKKNSRHFCPLPKTTSERQITQHVKVTRIDVLKTFSLWKSRSERGGLKVICQHPEETIRQR